MRREKAARLIQLLAALGVLLCCVMPILPKGGPHLVYSRETLRVREGDFEYYITNYRIRNDSFRTIGPDASPLVVSVDRPEGTFLAKVLSAPRSNGFAPRWDKDEGRAYFDFDSIGPGDTAVLTLGFSQDAHTVLSIGPEGAALPLQEGKVESMVLIIPFALFTLALAVCLAAEAAYTARRLRPSVPDPYPDGLFRMRKQKAREYVEPRKRTRFARVFYRYWPVSFTALWIVCYWLLFWV